MDISSRCAVFPRDFSLQWHITERCNWSCKHCYRKKESVKELPLNNLFEIFFQYIDLIEALKIPKGCARLNIAGGEPFIRKDFFKFLEFIHKHSNNRLDIGILSNGSYITEKNVSRLKSLGVNRVQLSLEGMKKANDQIRGKGTFDKIIEKAKLLIGADILTVISLTLTKENAYDIPLVVKLCDSLGVGRLGIRRFVPIGHGKRNKLNMLPPGEQKAIYYWKKRARNEMKLKNRKLHIAYGCEDGIFTNDLNHRRMCGVIEGRCLTLFSNGDVLACRRLPIKLGNVLQKSLLEVYFSSDKLWQLRDPNNAYRLCQRCRDFKFCRGGALCISHGYFNKLFMPDPQCWRIFKNIPSKHYKP